MNFFSNIFFTFVVLAAGHARDILT